MAISALPDLDQLENDTLKALAIQLACFIHERADTDLSA
jgi:hypothetical protein